MEKLLNEVVEKFKLTNDYTSNKNVWVGHACIGREGKLNISEAKSFLSEHFDEFIRENEQTPIWLISTLKQWENIHPFQNVREIDQPLFIKKIPNNKIILAVIWPWQIRENVASLVLYQGDFINE